MRHNHSVIRRGLLATAAGVGVGVGVGMLAAPLAARAEDMAFAAPSITDPAAALQALMEGNQRWQDDTIKYRGYTRHRMQLGLAGQTPFVVVVGCIDSRVPPEILFDQDVNDMFDVRTAAQVLAPGRGRQH